MKSSKTFFGVLIALLVIGGIFAVIGFGGSDDLSPTVDNTQPATEQDQNTPQGEQEQTEQAADKTFNLDMFNYGYSNSELRVSPGDVVTINLTNTGGTHNFTLDELNVASDTINTGETTSVTFTVPEDASGSFEYYCSVGNHRQLGMVGTLIVN